MYYLNHAQSYVSLKLQNRMSVQYKTPFANPVTYIKIFIIEIKIISFIIEIRNSKFLDTTVHYAEHIAVMS